MDAGRLVTATIELRPIGFVRGGRKEPFNDDWDSVTATIELDTDWLGAEAILGLDGFSHAVVLFRFHVADPRRSSPARGIRATTRTCR